MRAKSPARMRGRLPRFAIVAPELWPPPPWLLAIVAAFLCSAAAVGVHADAGVSMVKILFDNKSLHVYVDEELDKAHEEAYRLTVRLGKLRQQVEQPARPGVPRPGSMERDINAGRRN